MQAASVLPADTFLKRTSFVTEKARNVPMYGELLSTWLGLIVTYSVHMAFPGLPPWNMLYRMA